MAMLRACSLMEKIIWVTLGGVVWGNRAVALNCRLFSMNGGNWLRGDSLTTERKLRHFKVFFFDRLTLLYKKVS